jgi:hypothetical protein
VWCTHPCLEACDLLNQDLPLLPKRGDDREVVKVVMIVVITQNQTCSLIHHNTHARTRTHTRTCMMVLMTPGSSWRGTWKRGMLDTSAWGGGIVAPRQTGFRPGNPKTSAGGWQRDSVCVHEGQGGAYACQGWPTCMPLTTPVSSAAASVSSREALCVYASVARRSVVCTLRGES